MVEILLAPMTLRIAGVVLIAGTPLVALLWWYREGRARQGEKRFRALCAMLGAAGPLLALLWLLQQGLFALLGLDSFVALLISLCGFAGVGLAGGYLLRRTLESRTPETGANSSGEDRP